MSNVTAARILVVDNDEAFRAALCDQLEELGYKVDSADGCMSAKERLLASSYTLALVDLQMENFKGDVSDDAGVELAKYIHDNFPDLPVIIITSIPGYTTARMVGRLGIADYLAKETELVNIGEKIAKNIKRNLSLRVERPPGQAELSEEEKEIIQKLFLNSTAVRVHDFGRGARGVRLYRVDSRDADGTWIIPLMVKIAWRDSIIEELTRFERYAKHKIPNSRYPEIVATAFAGRRGGMACAFVGGFDFSSTATLREYYSLHTTVEVQRLIERIFTELFRIWHENKGSKEPINLFDEYEGVIFEQSKIESAVSTHLKGLCDLQKAHVTYLGREFANPIVGLRNLRKSYYVRTYLSTVHGDLNGGNVLIDQSNNLWLIDFERTCRSHIVKDYSELEVALKYQLLEDLSLQEIAELEEELAAAPSLTAHLRLPGAAEGVQKALRVVRTIRHQAEVALAPSANPTEYFVALLYYTLNCLRFPNDEISVEKKGVVLYAASLMLQRIESQLQRQS